MASETVLPRYTWDEIQKHKDATSLWMVFDNKVYDVTKWVNDHPGGDEVLLKNAGVDATAAFDDVGHSEDAIEKRKEFLIGVLDESPPAQNQRCCSYTWGFGVALAVAAVAVGAFVAYKYLRK